MHHTTRTLLALAVLAALTSCSHQHLSPTFGIANHEAYAMQKSPPAARPPTMALDTQEAAVISGVYLKDLATKEGSGYKPEPILLVGPQRAGQEQPLMPSVPKP